MIGYTYFNFLYENIGTCFPNFGAARTPYLMYDVYAIDSPHGMCFPTVILFVRRLTLKAVTNESH